MLMNGQATVKDTEKQIENELMMVAEEGEVWRKVKWSFMRLQIHCNLHHKVINKVHIDFYVIGVNNPFKLRNYNNIILRNHLKNGRNSN